MLSLLASINVELPFRPEDILFAMVTGMWNGFVLFLSAMPWWLWLVLVGVLLIRFYRRLDRMLAPAEFRQRHRRQRRDW